MKKIRKSITIMMLSIFTMMLFTGCGGKSEMGRYEETDLKSPEGLLYSMDMAILENGDIAMIGNGEDYEKLNYYTSKDNGEIWETKEIKTPQAPEGKDIHVRNVKIKKDGSLFIISGTYQKMEMPENVENLEGGLDDSQTGLDGGMEPGFEMPQGEYICSLVDVQGNSTEIKIENTLLDQSGKIEIDNNGDIFIDNYETAKIVQLDGKTGAVKREYKIEGDYISSWAVNGKTLLAASFEDIIEFDTETGKNKGKIELDNELRENGLNLCAGIEEKMFYSTNVNGVYNLEIGKKTQKQVIDGSLSSLGDVDVYIQKLVQKSDTEFIASFSSMEGGNLIKYYKYNSELASKPENQITIYSLYNNDTMRQAAVKYQKANPDVYINLDSGISYLDENVNVSDEVKKINTEIMAGKGPDIIVLDGLPSKSYAEKGVLEDITDIVTKDDMLLSNIINGSKSGDGKIYSVPMKFFVPTIMGNDVAGINSLSTLAAGIDGISAKATGSVMDVYAPDELVYLLYKNSGDSWVNDDKTINIENLKSFLEDTKKIYDSIKDKHSQEKIAQHAADIETMKEYMTDQSYAEMMFSNGTYYDSLLRKDPTAVALYNFTSAQDLEIMQGFKTVKKDLTYEMWKGQDTDSVIPVDTIAINAKSEKKDISKDFMKSLITEEYQTVPYSYGFPVNKASFQAAFVKPEDQYGGGMTMGFGEEEMIEIPMEKVSEEAINAFIAQIESFESIANPDIEVLRKTIDEFTAYISGSKSIDETIKAIQSKLEIYLAE